MYKIVNLPICVPLGIYCWDKIHDIICHHFDNEGGHPMCELDLGTLNNGDQGVLKPPRCMGLEKSRSQQ